MLWRRWAFLDGFGGASRSSSNAYLTPAGVSLPFLSQHFVQGCEMVDVISIDIGPNLGWQGLFYCFPPFCMIDNFLAHLQECSGRCVVILLENFGLWYPKFVCGTRVQKVICLSKVGSKGAVLCFWKEKMHLKIGEKGGEGQVHLHHSFWLFPFPFHVSEEEVCI